MIPVRRILLGRKLVFTTMYVKILHLYEKIHYLKEVKWTLVEFNVLFFYFH